MFDEISEHHDSAKMTHKINHQGSVRDFYLDYFPNCLTLVVRTMNQQNAYLKMCIYIHFCSKQIIYIYLELLQFYFQCNR